MSQEIQEPPSLPVFVVTGANFTAVVNLDEYNAQFDLTHQQFEACTRAIETLKNIREDESCKIVMNAESRDENPKIGVTVLVHAKDSNPDNALPIPVYLLFGNCGLYPEADKFKADFDKRFAEQKKLDEASRKQTEQEAADLQKFAKSQTPISLKKPTPKKPRKK